MEIEKTTKVTLEFDGEDIAKMFSELGASELADFFNTVGNELKHHSEVRWFKANLKEAQRDGMITEDGLRIMAIIGDYATEK